MIFPGIGTVLNSLGVLTIGLLTRIFIKKDIKDFEKNLYPIGLVTLALAIRECLRAESLIIPLVSILIGATIGSLLRIEDRVENFGKFLHNKYEKDTSEQETFISSFLTTSLIVITGPLAIIGPFQDALENNLELLIIKTVLDCFLVFYITAGGGKGAMYSFIPIVVYQGFFTLLGLVLKNSFLTQVAVENIGSVGGILLLGLAIKILGIKEIPVGNYLPALFIPMLFI
jgi:hypothetical protein